MKMVASDSVLELRNIFHSGQVEPSSLIQRFFGNVETGLILKDVSFDVKAGEVFAVLGSKGSGKRCLLEVISRRAHGATRGQILLDGAPLTLSLFQETCGYVTHRTDLIPSLTTEQTLYYAANLSSGEKVSRYTCSTRVRQMLNDLALNQVAPLAVSSLTKSQYRRLVIGCQLIKEPVLILLDEPTAELDPLSTYLVVSILSSYARKKGRAVMLTMEKPRSDVFPFLDRAAFLCLGDILYAGPTRLMLDYFTSIGFPCPAVENPLMYYLCLSTVDRRSRERFLESNAQILELVEKFKSEGGSYMSSLGQHTQPLKPVLQPVRPSGCQVFATLYQRLLASTINITSFGLTHLFLRLALFPLYALLIFGLFFHANKTEHSSINQYGLILYCMNGAYLISSIVTAYTFGVFRTRYYQEAQEDMYGGPLFLLCYIFFSLPFSLVTVVASSRILFQATGLIEAEDWAVFGGVLWGCYLLAEYQTIAILMVVRSSFTALILSSYLTSLYVTLASGILRSVGSMPEWAVYLSYGCQPHYATAALSTRLFSHLQLSNCTPSAFGCKYPENQLYFAHRPLPSWPVDYNLCFTMAFPAIFALGDCLLYLMPLPAFVKAKFRD